MQWGNGGSDSPSCPPGSNGPLGDVRRSRRNSEWLRNQNCIRAVKRVSLVKRLLKIWTEHFNSTHVILFNYLPLGGFFWPWLLTSLERYFDIVIRMKMLTELVYQSKSVVSFISKEVLCLNSKESLAIIFLENAMLKVEQIGVIWVLVLNRPLFSIFL